MTHRPLLFGTVLALSSCAYAAEHSVPCNTLPAAVQQRSKSLLEPGTTLRGCVKDVSAGKITYEIELLTSQGSKDVTVSPQGEVLEVEQQVDPATLPAPVAAAFAKAATGGTLGKVESLTRQGQLIAFESTIEKGGKHHEVAFRPDGAPAKAD
ncbi:MAG TPA: hypothetical protein VHS13_06860 [Edaphobacter sp.]|nr:hypothetical protein [Edaphobacter sp.]